MSYIEGAALYNKIAALEELARNRYLDTPGSSPAYPRYHTQLSERTELKHLVADFPAAADVAPVVHGRWEFIGEGYANCTRCGMIFEALPTPFGFKLNNRFCRSCGAKMDLEVSHEA